LLIHIKTDLMRLKFISPVYSHSRKTVVFLMILFILTISQSCRTKSAETATFPYEEFDIARIQKGYLSGEFTVCEIVQAYLDRIDRLDKNGPGLASVLTVNPDAMKIAVALDAELKEGKTRGPLFGIPVLLKDNIDTHDNMPCTAGSRALKSSYPLKDSYVAGCLRAAGAVIIGKTNLSEWANFRGELSSSGWSGLGGQTRNPYVINRNPCGSSSGSGVAVSANLTVLAIGTETDGSIVCPSNNNGIVGIKPTVGLISRTGIIPISFTQDTPGPMARTVADAAICLGALTGVDSSDLKSLQSEGKFLTDYTPYFKKDGLKGKRIGLYKSASGINFKVDEVMEKAVQFIKNSGAEVVDIGPISGNEADNASFTVMVYEYKDGLNKYFKSLGKDAPVKTIDELIAFNLKDSVELSFFNQKYLELASGKGDLSESEYKEALALLFRSSRKEGIDRIMDSEKLDAIIAPTGGPAWKTDHTNGDYYQLGTSSPAARAGYPAISVPMGFIDDLPVGITFFGRAWSEPVLIEMAYSFEQGTKHRRSPGFKTID
jgi:amidase